MVLVGLELPLADPLVNADQGVARDVLAVVHTWGAECRELVSHTQGGGHAAETCHGCVANTEVHIISLYYLAGF